VAMEAITWIISIGQLVAMSKKLSITQINKSIILFINFLFHHVFPAFKLKLTLSDNHN